MSRTEQLQQRMADIGAPSMEEEMADKNFDAEKDFDNFADYIESDLREFNGSFGTLASLKTSQVCEMCDEGLTLIQEKDLSWCVVCGVIHTEADGLWVLA